MANKLYSWLFALACQVALTGCGREGDHNVAGGEQSEPPVVRLAYFPNVTHAQALLGVASGDFARAVAPAKLETRVFNAGPSLVEALFAGQIDIGYIGPGPALNAFAKSGGQSIRVIAGAAANGVLIVARPGSGIKRMEDLGGHKIATPQLGNTQDISARHYLRSVLKQSDLSNVLTIANPEQAALMSRGQIDAAWVPEPWGSQLVAEAGANVIGQEKDLWPDGQFTLTLVVTTPEFLAKYPKTVERFLAAHRAWTARLQQDAPSYAAQVSGALEQLTGKTPPQPILKSALGRVQFTDEPLADTLAAFARWSYELEFSPQPIDPGALVDTTILRKLQAAAAARTGPLSPSTQPAVQTTQAP